LCERPVSTSIDYDSYRQMEVREFSRGIDSTKQSKAGALLTFTAIALLARVLQRFTVPHFYGWYADAWLFFFTALLLGSYLLLRISVALTGARKN
jgi:hypothetical protein